MVWWVLCLMIFEISEGMLWVVWGVVFAGVLIFRWDVLTL